MRTLTGLNAVIAAAMAPASKARVQSALMAAVASGSVPAQSERSLFGALERIDSTLQSRGQLNGKANRGRIEQLIEQMVLEGRLSREEAGQLRGLFNSVAPLGLTQDETQEEAQTPDEAISALGRFLEDLKAQPVPTEGYQDQGQPTQPAPQPLLVHTQA